MLADSIWKRFLTNLRWSIVVYSTMCECVRVCVFACVLVHIARRKSVCVRVCVCVRLPSVYTFVLAGVFTRTFACVRACMSMYVQKYKIASSSVCFRCLIYYVILFVHFTVFPALLSTLTISLNVHQCTSRLCLCTTKHITSSFVCLASNFMANISKCFLVFPYDWSRFVVYHVFVAAPDCVETKTKHKRSKIRSKTT